METRAYLKGTRLSPQKAGLVADVIRGKSIQDAMDFLASVSYTHLRAHET